MSSKYHGLPDIDTAPDIFETPDEPTVVVQPDPSYDDAPTKPPASELIDASALPARRQAGKVFLRASRKGASFTFRPTHASSSDTDSDAGGGIRETPAARVRRLRVEIAEVERELAAPRPPVLAATGPPTQRPDIDLVGEVAALRARVEGLDVEPRASQWRDRLGHVNEPRVQGDEVGSVREADGKASLTEVDRRLARLEEVVGPSNYGLSDDQASPLLPTLARLDHLASLLSQPRHLDAISRRVKLLLVELDRAAAASASATRRAPSTPALGADRDRKGGAGGGGGREAGSSAGALALSPAEHASLDHVFALLPRLDPLLPILAPLLNRLKSLATLHAEAGATTDALRKLQTGKRRVADEVNELRDVVDGLRMGVEESARGVERNWDAVEQRIKALDERIKALSA
ncbi:hypothetical protein Q5752_001150 [Cryptotrichosporon argae]